MKPTAAQLALIHTGESALASGLLTVFAGGYQYWTLHHFDFPGLLSFLLIAFLGCMVMVYKTMQADPAFSQAEKDTLEEAKALGVKAIGHIEDMWPVLRGLQATQKAATPVIAPINLSMPQNVTAAAQSVPMAATFVPQLPFPPTATLSAAMPGLPSRDGMWNDSQLMPAMPHPPKG